MIPPSGVLPAVHPASSACPFWVSGNIRPFPLPERGVPEPERQFLIVKSAQLLNAFFVRLQNFSPTSSANGARHHSLSSAADVLPRPNFPTPVA
jgi:hypothetical protein